VVAGLVGVHAGAGDDGLEGLDAVLEGLHDAGRVPVLAPLGLELEQGEIIELLVLGEPLLELVAVGTPQLLLERAVVLDATLACTRS
jgi:hypothetical protein